MAERFSDLSAEISGNDSVKWKAISNDMRFFLKRVCEQILREMELMGVFIKAETEDWRDKQLKVFVIHDENIIGVVRTEERAEEIVLKRIRSREDYVPPSKNKNGGVDSQIHRTRSDSTIFYKWISPSGSDVNILVDEFDIRGKGKEI